MEECIVFIDGHVFRQRQPWQLNVLIEDRSDTGRRDVIPLGNGSECLCLRFKILQNVRADVDKFVGGAEQFDDLTMLCVEYRGK